MPYDNWKLDTPPEYDEESGRAPLPERLPATTRTTEPTHTDDIDF